MKVELSKKELTLINKIMGFIQDYEASGDAPEHVTDVCESDEFNDLNEKLAEKLADS